MFMSRKIKAFRTDTAFSGQHCSRAAFRHGSHMNPGSVWLELWGGEREKGGEFWESCF